MKRIWYAIFGEQSMLRQAYAQFFLAIALFALFFLPNRILLQLTFILSVWAILITAQGFISAASSNRKLMDIVDKLEDIVDRLEKLQTDVKSVKAETVESDTVEAKTVVADDIEEY